MSLFGFTFARIYGDSMEPVLPAGSLALFRARRRVERGDVVLVDHPQFGVIVKRVREIIDGEFALEGISPASTSAERLGRVTRQRVQGVMVAKLR